MTIKEEREYNIIDEKITYDSENKKWQAEYPWLRDPMALPNNRSAVLGILKATEKRLEKLPHRGEKYQQQIEDMLSRKVCRKLSRKEMASYKGPVFYISHHEVVKEDSV